VWLHADHAGMANPALYEEWISSVHRLKQVQRAAGIVEPLADLSGRNACAYSGTPSHYGDDYRKAVFAIPDEAVRRQIIREERENYRIYKAYLESELGSLFAHSGSDAGPIRRKSLWGAVAFGACIVWLGSEIWGSAGALIGAVIAILVAVDHIRRADRRAAANAKIAQYATPGEEARLVQIDSDDGTFSAAEEKTGLPDSPARRSTGAPEPLRP
jgi:hypothetical protein